MADPFFNAESCADRHAYLRQWFPEHLRQITLGEELLSFAADRSNRLDHAVQQRFWMREVVFMGDSAGTARFNERDGDLIAGPIYLRVRIYPNEPPKPPLCVHYHACLRGMVCGILPSHSVLSLMVAADNYLITETF